MKKLFIVLALASALWLQGCYYSRYISDDNNYYVDSSYYYAPPIVDPAPIQPVGIAWPLPYPVNPPSNPPVPPVKYRTDNSIRDGHTSTNPDAYRESKRNIDMTNVKRNPVDYQPEQNSTVAPRQDESNSRTLRNSNSNNGNDGKRVR